MNAPSPLSLFGMSLLRTARVWRQETSQFLQASHGLSEASVLPMIALRRLGDGVTQKALADYMGISGPSLVRIIDGLVGDGWVERRESDTDRRAKTLHFTRKGRQRIGIIDEDLMAVRKQLVKQVSAADLETCLRVFAAIESASPLKRPLSS
jgi:MarR family transcriptional regulator for hemolysin